MFMKSSLYPVVLNYGDGRKNLLHLDVENRTDEIALYQALSKQGKSILLSPKQLIAYQRGDRETRLRPEQVLHGLGSDQIILLAREKQGERNEPFFEFQGQKFYFNNPPNIFTAYGKDGEGILRRVDGSLLGEKNLNFKHDPNLGRCYLIRASRNVKMQLVLSGEFCFVDGDTGKPKTVAAGRYEAERIFNTSVHKGYWLAITGAKIGMPEGAMRVFTPDEYPDRNITVEESNEPSGLMKTGDGVVAVKFADGHIESVSEDIAWDLRSTCLSKKANGDDESVGSEAWADIEDVLMTGENLPV